MVASIKNLVNDVYSRDISRKIISAFRTKQRNGEFIGLAAPYGYLKSKENKNRLVVDEGAAPVVRRIFRLYADGASMDRIVRILDGDGIDCPRKYRYRIGVTKSDRYKDSRWGRAAVRTILMNRAYIGDMVQGKERQELCNNIPKHHTDRSEWIVAEGTHEPVVDRELFFRVQGILEERQREQAERRERSRISEHKEEGMRRNEVVKVLNEEGVPTPAVYKQGKGCTRDWFPEGKKGGWNTSMVAKIIRDERYAGHMVSGKKAYESFDSRRQVGVDKSEWIVVRDTHEGIVTQEKFDRANGNMRSVVQGRKREPANKGNYSVIVCPHCGLTLRPGTQKESILYCPTGRMYRESPCSRVRMRKALAEDTLVRLVRKQAELLLEAEKVLKGRKGKEPGADAGSLRAEVRRLDEAKISGYEDYEAGRMSRERFVERKRELDIRRKEVSAAMSEAEAREIVEESGKREYREAQGIREYLHLEGYDKRVMASLIESAKVMGEDRLEVVWKFGDVYEKILGEMR